MSMLEMATALAAVSVPGFKPLLDRRDAKHGTMTLSQEVKSDF